MRARFWRFFCVAFCSGVMAGTIVSEVSLFSISGVYAVVLGLFSIVMGFFSECQSESFNRMKELAERAMRLVHDMEERERREHAWRNGDKDL